MKMARNSFNLLELDVDKLFEDHKIEEIIEIEKILDAEIERKRVDLRLMVGDRYKDVLAASDAIKNMTTISQDIVENIQKITDTCEKLISESSAAEIKHHTPIKSENIEERALIIQVRLVIFLNEQMWISLEAGDNLKAAQLYLLAQHIHMGLSLVKNDYLQRIPLVNQIKCNLQTLRHQIFQKINEKLESVEITAEDTSSNLNALLLVQNQSTRELLDIFISHRKIALNTVINSSHPSVRIQVSSMVRCLMTTIHLLHDCFMTENGLIIQQLQGIVGESAPPTLTKLALPSTPLISYIPEIIKQFKPKCKGVGESLKGTIALEDWLNSTKSVVKSGLQTSLNLVTNVKGLHIIREEALKIDLPPKWDKICTETNLPDNFNVWYYFFQNLMTIRAKMLISIKVSSIVEQIEGQIIRVMSTNSKLDQIEADLRNYTWIESPNDVSRTENKHTGLSMKTLGYSQNIVSLAEALDQKYLELLVDVSQYLYGREYDEANPTISINSSDFKMKKKFIDKDELENHLRVESTSNSTKLSVFLQDFVQKEKELNALVLKSLVCARFLQAVTNLCPHFNKCCSFNGNSEDWSRICTHFQTSALRFWEKWVENSVENTKSQAEKEMSNITSCSMISILPRWDTIEIQEQTEDKVFKSQIKVPLKPSLVLHTILNNVNDDLSRILPQTLPKLIHLQYIERNTDAILRQYSKLADQEDLNQNQALQFLFDVKFLTTFCIPRENATLIAASQQVCDKLRAKIDPFDLDVFYSHLQSNVKRAVLQSQVILGCLLPSTAQLANLGITEKFKDQEKEPSILALSVPSMTSWFPLLPISAPSQKTATNSLIQKEAKSAVTKPTKPSTPKKSQDPTAVMRSSAAALFGGLTTDWFS